MRVAENVYDFRKFNRVFPADFFSFVFMPSVIHKSNDTDLYILVKNLSLVINHNDLLPLATDL